MKKIHTVILLVIIMITAISASAQDKIYLKDRKIIECKIIEIGSIEVKYKQYESKTDIVFSIEKNKIKKIILENGEEILLAKKEIYNPDNYLSDNNNAIKVNFLSPLYGSLKFSFEHNIKPGMSMEGSLGFIGVGVNIGSYDNIGGANFGFGIKFITMPDYLSDNRIRYSHLLHGFYVSPNIQFAIYSYTDYRYVNSIMEQYTESVNSAALLISIGKQRVFNNIFCIDWNVGIGYGISSSGNGTYGFSYYVGPKAFPIALSSNFRVGILFSGKRKKSLKSE